MTCCSEKQAESHLVLDTHRCLRAYLDAPEHDADHSDAMTRLLRLQHIGGQLSSAVAHLHALCIIHRDLSARCCVLLKHGLSKAPLGRGTAFPVNALHALPCAEPENVMVRHAHTPQGLAYRDGSGLACVLADFGSAKMLPPLNAAATELDPHVDHVFAATRFGQLALQGLLAAPASLHPSDAWATTAGHARRPCLRHIGTSRPGRARASRTSAHGRTAHPSSSTAQSATAASPTVRVRVCACVTTCLRPSTRPSGNAGPCACVDAQRVYPSAPTVPPPLSQCGPSAACSATSCCVAACVEITGAAHVALSWRA